MNKELIPHVFASLQSLERYVDIIKSSLESSDHTGNELRAMVPQYETTLKKMRRTANKLQFQVAADNQQQIIRSLRIFYGLNHMVRPEILSSFLSLSKGSKTVGSVTPEAVASFH